MSAATVVVSLDGTDTGWRALAWAVAETAALDGRLVMHHPADPNGPLAVAGAWPATAVLKNANPMLTRALAGARARRGGDRVALTVDVGDPATALPAAAATAQLVVLGAEEQPVRTGLPLTGQPAP
jgi:hypothetical protein